MSREARRSASCSVSTFSPSSRSARSAPSVSPRARSCSTTIVFGSNIWLLLPSAGAHAGQESFEQAIDLARGLHVRRMADAVEHVHVGARRRVLGVGGWDDRVVRAPDDQD